MTLEIMNNEKFLETYVVEKNISVVVKIGGESKEIRIEVLRDVRDGVYHTRAYSRENLTLQPTYPQTHGKYDRSPEAFRVWVDYELPWTRNHNPDNALSQALGFLLDRCEL